MSLLPPNVRVEQAQAELSRLLQETGCLPEEDQNRIATAIEALTHQLNRFFTKRGADSAVEAAAGSQIKEKEADEILYENRYRLGKVLRGANAGLFVRDLVKYTSVWSPELREIIGVAPGDPSSPDKFVAMIHPEDRPKVVEYTQAAICRGGSFYQEFRLIRPDGQMIWLSSIGFVEHDPQGRPLSITGINQDITERKMAEAQLQESEAQLRESENQARQHLAEIETIYQNAPIGLCVFDNQLRWVRLNQRIAEINGVPLEDHLGKTPKEIVPDVGEQAEEAMQTILETGQPLLDFEMRGTTAAQPGVERIWNERWMPIKDDQGVIIGISVAAEEITERKRAEEALKREHEHIAWLASIPEQNPGPVLRASLEGVVQYCNQAASELPGSIFTVGEPMPDILRSLLELTLSEGKRVENDIQLGSQYYSITVTPSTGEQYVNIYGKDITKRKQAEEALRKNTEALRESEEKFRGAFVGAAIGFAMTTPDGHFLDANPAYCSITGYGLEELRAFAFNQLLHPDDRAQNIELNRQMSAGLIKDFVIENRYIRKNGQVVWVRKSVSQVRDRDDIPKWNIALVEDITERKQAEALLNERNMALEQAHNDLINERNRLVAVMEALPVGLAIYDNKGGVIQANPGFDAVWGSPRPPANSVEDYDLYKAWWVETGERVQPEEWAAARAVQNGETVTGQYIQIRRFDGTQGYVFNSGAPVRDVNGQIIGGAVAIMDVTERVQIEQALQESKDRFRVALASVPLLVYTCDRDQRYTWVYNPLRGFHTEDVLGKRDDELLPPEAVAELVEAKQKALDTGQGGVQEIKIASNGDTNYYILTTDPIKNAHGQVTGLTCSAIDITEQKRLAIEQKENEMRMEVQRRLMEQREQERQGIARDIHDGPIQTLVSTAFNLQFVKEVYSDPNLELELNQISLNVKNAVRELREVVNDLRPPSIIRFGLSKAIQMHVEDLRERYPEIEIRTDLTSEREHLSDEACLTMFRVFQEGMNNIFRHADASKVWVRYAINPDSFTLELRDNGKGFVVQPDFTNLTGAGHFGLAGMKERVEAVGGEFMLTSQPGQGTTILVKCPLLENHSR